ncbi:MAG: hypothetical protein EOM25_06795 [Deltaproteobacteria bacterium]|nr:hypothetical protein [Deltaproteobacteria bacterium]
MAGTDFRFHNLSGADLSCSDLSGADLSYSDLSNTNLQGANIRDTDFSHTDVTGTNASCGQPSTCACSQQPETANCFFIAPAHQCPYFAPDQNQTFYDDTLITFYSCEENGTNVCPKGTTVNGTVPQCLVLPNGSIWKVVVENAFFKVPFPAVVQVTDEGWDYAAPCDGPDADTLDICLARKVMPASPTNRRFGPGCVPNDTSISSYPRAYLLDQKNGNLLFRGSEPCVTDSQGNYHFDYDNLMATLMNLYKTQLSDKSTFPSTFRFVDISLINDTGEGPMLMAEYRFFGGNGTVPPSNATVPADSFLPLPSPKNTNSTVTGQFRWWYMRPFAAGAEQSDLGGLVDWISTLMTEETGNNPYVIYFHCSAGADRTGEVATSYLLKHRGMSPEQAFVYGTTTFDGQGGGSLARTRQIPIPDYLAGAIWYCQQLCPTGNCDYNSMDQSTVPGPTAYPCPYPWSSGKCDWGTSCDR